MTEDRDRVAIVTGGARGIGAAITKRFLDDGYCVLVVDVNAKALASLEPMVEAYPDRLDARQLSVSDRTAVEAAIDDLVARRGGVDAVVNNAGMTLPATFLDQTTTTGTASSIRTSRARSSWRRSRRATWSSRKRRVRQRRVRCRPTVSAPARRPTPRRRRARGLSAGSWPVQLAHYGIRVNTVVVGTTATPWLLGKKSDERARTDAGHHAARSARGSRRHRRPHRVPPRVRRRVGQLITVPAAVAARFAGRTIDSVARA